MTATHSPFVELQFLFNQSRLFKVTVQYGAAIMLGTSLALGIMSGYISDHSSKGKVLAATTNKPVSKTSTPKATGVVSAPSPTSPPQTQEEKWEQQAAEANSTGNYDRLAKCETHGDWQFESDNFAGGVGFMKRSWSYWKLDGMPDNANEASKAEQIVVAERIRWELSPKGSWAGGKWGCAGAAGLP